MTKYVKEFKQVMREELEENTVKSLDVFIDNQLTDADFLIELN